MPVEAELGSSPRGTRPQTLARYVDNLRQGLQTMHKLAFSHSDKAHERNKELYDRKTAEREYSPGDAVYLYSFFKVFSNALCKKRYLVPA